MQSVKLKSIKPASQPASQPAVKHTTPQQDKLHLYIIP